MYYIECRTSGDSGWRKSCHNIKGGFKHVIEAVAQLNFALAPIDIALDYRIVEVNEIPLIKTYVYKIEN